MDTRPEQKIDLNSAVPRDLAGLPGIDRLLARRIVLDRKLYGAFHSLDDLGRIEGIDSALIQELAGRVAIVEPEGAPAGGRLGLISAPVEGSKDAAVVLAGTPQFVRGTVAVRNDGRGVLQGTVLRLEKLTLPGAQPMGIVRLSVPGLLGPGEQRTVALTLAVDPQTPPGTYSAEVVVGNERHPAKILITERYSQTITPSILSVLNEPGSKTEHQVLVRNEGNVPITLSDFGGVVLEEVDLQCRVIREAVRRTKHPTWDELVGTVADELKQTFAQFEPLRVRVKHKAVRLDPGTTAVLTLQVQIPKNLPARRRYRGRLRLYDSSLTFELEPRLTAAESEAE